MRFIHIADVHLGARPDAGCPWEEERARELWDTFAWVAKECRDRQADLLLIAGDLFDHQPSVEELREADEILAGARETEVVIVAGEHDYLRRGSAYEAFSWSENVHLLKEEKPCSVYLEDIDTRVHGVSHRREEIPERLLDGIAPEGTGEIQILLAHGGPKDQLPFEMEKLSEAGFDYVALGHEHTPRLMMSKRVAYAGSLEPLSGEEIGHHGYIFGEIGGEGGEFMFVPFSTREYVTLKVRVSSDIEEDTLLERLRAVIKKQGEQKIYLITLEGRYRPQNPFSMTELYGVGNVLSVEDRTMPDYDLAALLDAHKDDVIGMYMEELLKKPSDLTLQKALYCGLEALLY